MSPHESQTINDLIAAVKENTDAVNGLRGDMRVLHTKLFGDPDKETDKGRIPMLEAAVQSHAKKLRRVEPIVVAWRCLYTLAVGATGVILDHLFPIASKGH